MQEGRNVAKGAGAGGAARLVYCPCPNEAVAREIGASLVAERLAACVNIVPRIVSIYRFRGAIAEDAEALLLAKTTAALAPAVVARIDAAHPHEVPAISVLTTAGASAKTLAWLAEETGAAA